MPLSCVIQHIVISIASDEHPVWRDHCENDLNNQWLVAYSPTDLETERLMNVARRFRYALAQKYERFSITEL